MDIKLWYSKHLRQWRWTLLEVATRNQQSGQSYDLQTAMNDITKTIEYMIEKHEYEGQEE